MIERKKLLYTLALYIRIRIICVIKVTCKFVWHIEWSLPLRSFTFALPCSRNRALVYFNVFFYGFVLDLILYQWYLLLLLYNLKCKLCTLSLHISMNGVCPPNYRLRLFWNKSASFYLNSRCDLPPFWTTSINSPIIKVTIEYTLYNECLSILSNVYCFFK